MNAQSTKQHNFFAVFFNIGEFPKNEKIITQKLYLLVNFLTQLYTGFFDNRSTQGGGKSPSYYFVYKTTNVVHKTSKYIQNNKTFCDFCLFFYDIITITGNFGGFPKNGNLGILKRCHVLQYNSAISRPKFYRVIPDMILHRSWHRSYVLSVSNLAQIRRYFRSKVKISKILSKNLFFGPLTERLMGEMGKNLPKNSNFIFQEKSRSVLYVKFWHLCLGGAI